MNTNFHENKKSAHLSKNAHKQRLKDKHCSFLDVHSTKPERGYSFGCASTKYI